MHRGVPQRYPELKLPQRVSDWTDDHYLRWFTQRGDDSVGDLILGAAALDRFLAVQSVPPAIAPSSRACIVERRRHQGEPLRDTDARVAAASPHCMRYI